ncbi:acyl-CoA thioesterase [candidate division KSB1 bacterium]|nr:MAG: acyl-CoA thioesterase [candidate division KSB1 bacterium]
MKKWATGSKPELPGLEDSTSLRVRYAETDAMGWVYYANYFTYFEVGRTEMIRRSWRSYSDLEHEGYRLPVIESHCRYFHGARYDDQLDIQTRLTLPTALRLHFEYRVVRVNDGKLLAEGFTVHCFLGESGKPVPVPAELRMLVTA